MIDLSLDLILTILVLSFWFLFPLGTFLVIFLNDNELDELNVESGKRIPAKSRSAGSGRPRLIPH